jgi:hypothetical protein
MVSNWHLCPKTQVTTVDIVMMNLKSVFVKTAKHGEDLPDTEAGEDAHKFSVTAIVSDLDSAFESTTAPDEPGSNDTEARSRDKSWKANVTCHNDPPE